MDVSMPIFLRDGLPRLSARIRDEEAISVAFLGGSITEGYGASDPDATSWRALTERYFRDAYPDIRWRFVNAGVGGTDSSFGAHRFARHALQDGRIDLLFVEFAVNDAQKRAKSPEGRAEAIRGMEGIVRQCRRWSPSADIVFLYVADEESLAEDEPFFVSAHEEVAERYALPSVSFVHGIRACISPGVWRSFAPDGVHPNDEGYAVYAGIMREFLDVALKKGAISVATSPLPEPLRADNYEKAALTSPLAALLSTGMVWSGRPENTVNWRYPAGHWHGEGEGAEIVFETHGRGAGLLLLCGPDSGAFAYSVNGGEFLVCDPFDEWCPLFYRPVRVALVDSSVAGPIRITVRGTGLKDERSTGNELRVLGLLHYE
ncbi:SGNH/GDSL hydrolase family protein [Cohnella sp. GCM10027633]|uniref:SGNH/GDSL hydrolase family protein n=1 Tax=unclassified Cohnella TaxID=2636738 RepID=UPI0036309CD7